MNVEKQAQFLPSTLPPESFPPGTYAPPINLQKIFACLMLGEQKQKSPKW